MEYKNYSEIQVQDFVYNMLMDSIYANLYITDVDTYEVLYMNRVMKEMFQVEHPEGRPCWQANCSKVQRREPAKGWSGAQTGVSRSCITW